MKRRGDKAHSCRRPTPKWNDCDLFTIYMNTNFRLTVEWLNGRQHMPKLPINAILPQHSPELISRNPVVCLFRSTKHAKTSFANSKDFLKICLSENLVRGLRPGRKPHLLFSNWFHYFATFPFKALGIPRTPFWKAKMWYCSIIRLHFTIAFLVNRNDHTCLPVFWCFSKFPRDLTHPRQSTYFLFRSFNISDRILSSPAAFPNFNPRMAAATSVNLKTSSFPKSIVPHILMDVAFTKFNKSSKCSLQRERISFSSRRMFPVEPLMEVVVLKLFPRNRQMVCQNTLFADD